MTDGEEITARAASTRSPSALGVPPPRGSRCPFPVVYAVAALLEWRARTRCAAAAPPPLTRYGVRLVACDCRYDIGKARRELGYRPALTFRQGIVALVRAAGEP